MKDWAIISDQYIAESLKEGRFLNSREIDENDNIDCTYNTIVHNFDDIENFRFRCMCEMAVWTKSDLKSFMEHMELNTKFNRNHPSEYRIV